MRDHRDLVLEDLAADLHAAQRERDSYRELLNLTLTQLNEALAREHRRTVALSLMREQDRRAA